MKKKPVWVVNMISFGVLIIIVLSYFFWQVNQVQKSFNSHIHENTHMVADIIRLNAGTSVTSQEIIEDIIKIFLINTARFIDYLDSVEPFLDPELKAYALETGLSGISIVTAEGLAINEGPDNWLGEKAIVNYINTNLRHIEDRKLYCLSYPRIYKKGYIIVGHPASAIEKLQEQIGLPKILQILADLPGFKYIKIVKKTEITHPGAIKIFEVNDNQIAETTMLLGDDALVIGLDAQQYFYRVRQLWYEFFLFGIIIAFLGFVFSLIIYNYQKKYLDEMQKYEREMAKEKEDAALGRASSTITHEIRNPVNAINMGLQRLQLEENKLDAEHQQLISSMLMAVKRTNGIITELNRYAKPIKPVFSRISPEKIIASVLPLYKAKCATNKIELNYSVEFKGFISGDAGLLETVIENLVLNAVEAQPDGGFINIRLFYDAGFVIISFTNSGFNMKKVDAHKILEPYFTTKTTGSGLGLAISEKIIIAHNGQVKLFANKPGQITISLLLPGKEIYAYKPRNPGNIY